MSRRPQNLAEGAFFDAALAAGWEPTKRGWPDFFMEKDGVIAAVEVKPSTRTPLKRSQRRVMEALAAHGVPCFRWTPDGGFDRI